VADGDQVVSSSSTEGQGSCPSPVTVPRKSWVAVVLLVVAAAVLIAPLLVFCFGNLLLALVAFFNGADERFGYHGTFFVVGLVALAFTMKIAMVIARRLLVSPGEEESLPRKRGSHEQHPSRAQHPSRTRLKSTSKRGTSRSERLARPGMKDFGDSVTLPRSSPGPQGGEGENVHGRPAETDPTNDAK
jgi:hypothetical protein